MKAWTDVPRDRDARRLAIVLVAVVALALSHFWLWGHVYDSASAFRDRQTQQVQLANIRQLVENIRAVDGTEETLVDQAEVAFPVADTVPLVVERVEAIAETQGVSLTTQSITDQKDETPKKKLTPLDITLAAAGPPHAVLAFMEALEHMQEFTQIESWTMEQLPALQNGAKVYNLTMTIRFFVQSR